jgi:hypothetical protein
MGRRCRSTVVSASDVTAAFAVVVLIGCFALMAIRSGPALVPPDRSVRVPPTQQPPENPDREAPVEEITLDHFPGFTSSQHFQRVVIRRDGTVTRHEGGVGEDESLSLGMIGPQDYRHLEGLLDRTRFFEMEGAGYPADVPFTEISAVRAGRRKRVTGHPAIIDVRFRDYSPPGFREIERAINGVVSRVTFRERIGHRPRPEAVTRDLSTRVATGPGEFPSCECPACCPRYGG